MGTLVYQATIWTDLTFSISPDSPAFPTALSVLFSTLLTNKLNIWDKRTNDANIPLFNHCIHNTELYIPTYSAAAI